MPFQTTCVKCQHIKEEDDSAQVPCASHMNIKELELMINLSDTGMEAIEVDLDMIIKSQQEFFTRNALRMARLKNKNAQLKKENTELKNRISELENRV